MAQYTVMGRRWTEKSRDYTKLTEVTFERREDADGFMEVNKQWIRGMCLYRDSAARRLDKLYAAVGHDNVAE